ncbi:MAG: ankyrin repeat domain-containing protein, partial [Bosea sp.]|nr:ankyrin repeat domain-containing protein [Bosea sp. (in: a-proteobacteria)]
ADRGCISIAKELLSRGASISARDRSGNTAVARAARHGVRLAGVGVQGSGA